ncbi:hypothetical protein, partial [Hyalangium sp.]|uniref:hypothetical protein n=1 Tax=Hyalangium sp. TaxID=2028555 RepID=UPI002D5FFE99
ARTPETKNTVAAAKPAVETKVAPGLTPRDEFKPGKPGIGIIKPFPLPPLFQPDAKTRATQANQLGQVADGVRDGSITAQESEKLLKEQQDIAAYQQKAMADGKLSKGEQLQLGVMQARAALNVHQASTNGDRNLFAGLDKNAQRQADQIDQIAAGRRSGNITNTEAGELLGDQVEISDARGDADSVGERLELGSKLNEADGEIKHHSKPGTQWDLKPFPHPFPLPRPQPLPLPLPEFPRPLPLPRPELPNKPDFQILPYKGVING